MADKKRRNTPNTGNKRNNGRRKKKGRLKGVSGVGKFIGSKVLRL